MMILVRGQTYTVKLSQVTNASKYPNGTPAPYTMSVSLGLLSGTTPIISTQNQSYTFGPGETRSVANGNPFSFVVTIPSGYSSAVFVAKLLDANGNAMTTAILDITITTPSFNPWIYDTNHNGIIDGYELDQAAYDNQVGLITQEQFNMVRALTILTDGIYKVRSYDARGMATGASWFTNIAPGGLNGDFVNGAMTNNGQWPHDTYRYNPIFMPPWEATGEAFALWRSEKKLAIFRVSDFQRLNVPAYITGKPGYSYYTGWEAQRDGLGVWRLDTWAYTASEYALLYEEVPLYSPPAD